MINSKKIIFLSLIFVLLINCSALANTKYKITPLNKKVKIYNTQTKDTKIQTTVSQNYNQEKNNDYQLQNNIQTINKNSLYQNQSSQELQEMINDIGQNIIRANKIKDNITFQYSDKEEDNAQVDDKNVVTINKGLIKKCENEDELAFVMGHEITHATNYHILKQKTAKKIGQAISDASDKPSSQNLAIQAAVLAGMVFGATQYSRIHENDADLKSIDYIVKAGYNPLGSISILKKIGTTYVDIVATHPSTDKRVFNTYTYIKKQYPAYMKNGYYSDDYDEAVRLYVRSKTGLKIKKHNK